MAHDIRTQLGYWLIGVGLLIAFAGQYWPTLPIVSAIAMIGSGVIQTLLSRPRTSRQDSLIVVNSTVYCTLIGLAIVAQSNAVLQDSLTQARLSMLLDHAVAIVLLVRLMLSVFFRLSQPTT